MPAFRPIGWARALRHELSDFRISHWSPIGLNRVKISIADGVNEFGGYRFTGTFIGQKNWIGGHVLQHHKFSLLLLGIILEEELSTLFKAHVYQLVEPQRLAKDSGFRQILFIAEILQGLHFSVR